MGESELRLHRCCFTGHRPEKLKMAESDIIKGLRGAIDDAIAEGFSTFISGMARGVDIWAGEAVLKLRDAGAPIRLICAVPYPGFESRWSPNWRERYHAILDTADLVRYVSPKYSAECFQRRNEWMVDHAARVIAVYNGEPSGTRNTVRYAQSKGVNVVIVEACE